MQIRSKLTVQFIVIVAGILLVSLFFIYYKSKQYVDDEFYKNLRSKATMTAEMLIKNTINDSDLLSSNPATGSYLTASNENVLIYNQQFSRVYSLNFMEKDINVNVLKDILEKKEYRFSHGKLQAYGMLYTNDLKKQYIVISEAVCNGKELMQLRNVLILDFLLIISVVAIAGWFFAGRALKPVSRIMNQVDDILPTDLSKRLKVINQKDEVSRLVATFNRLLERIEFAFKTQKSFISNISHELKNPLTVITSQLEVVLSKERTVAEYHKTLGSVLEDVRELNRVSEKLMELAKLSSDATSIPFEPLRLDEMIWQARSTLLKSHTEYKVSVEMLHMPQEEEKLYINANEQLLKTALINLMENGCKFSPEKKVNVYLDFVDGKPQVNISDKGEGINEEELPMIFEPFYRSQRTGFVKGSGIGLSLVNSILKLHEIGIKVYSEKGKGTTFSLLFAN